MLKWFLGNRSILYSFGGDKEMKEFLKKIHNEEFRWYDQFILVSILSFLIALVGQILGAIITRYVGMITDPNDPVISTALMYFSPIGVWIYLLFLLLINKRRRPILKAFGTKTSGNNLKNLLIGLAIGFGLNFSCAVVAMLKKDIHIHFDQFDPLGLLIVLVCVFIQSSSEEALDRGYLYQVLRKGYRNPWVAIVVSSVMFSGMHLMNPGFGLIPFLNILASGLIFALAVYYFDSIWMAFGIHTGWNYTQSILLGLPNSGLVVPFSLFKLDTASAVSSFAYDVKFGIEGTILSTIVLYLACIVIFLIGEKRGVRSHNIWKEGK